MLWKQAPDFEQLQRSMRGTLLEHLGLTVEGFGDDWIAVRMPINANHLRPVPDGQFVIGRLSPVRVGRRMHVWNIEIRDPDDRLVCISRLTIMIVERS
jgi:1,4-dihydroxy-2-naphthoyl-CoA hydrolase